MSEEGQLNEDVGEDKLREYIFYTETKVPLPTSNNSVNKYFLGNNNGVSYYFYYEKSLPTTLNHKFLSTIKTKSENYVIYADINTLSADELKTHNITFKKIPRDIPKI